MRAANVRDGLKMAIQSEKPDGVWPIGYRLRYEIDAIPRRNERPLESPRDDLAVLTVAPAQPVEAVTVLLGLLIIEISPIGRLCRRPPALMRDLPRRPAAQRYTPNVEV